MNKTLEKMYEEEHNDFHDGECYEDCKHCVARKNRGE